MDPHLWSTYVCLITKQRLHVQSQLVDRISELAEAQYLRPILSIFTAMMLRAMRLTSRCICFAGEAGSMLKDAVERLPLLADKVRQCSDVIPIKASWRNAWKRQCSCLESSIYQDVWTGKSDEVAGRE
jgi:hypothetical protein